AIASGIPSQTNTGGDIVVISRNAFHNTQSLLCGGIHGSCWGEKRADFHVIAHTVIDGQVPVQPPVILEEETHGNIVEGIVGTSDSLDVRLWESHAIGLQAGQTRYLGCRRAGTSGSNGDEAVRQTE